MSDSTATIRHNDLLNRLVIDRSTMETVGRVEVLWMYPPAHKVLGFVCKAGLLGARKTAFTLSQIHTLGDNSVLVQSGGQETDGDRVSQLESLVGCEVWSDDGVKLGRIIDCMFNLQTGQISDYLFTPGRLAALTEGIYRLPPHKILSLGRKRVLVSPAIAKSLEPYREGLKRKVGRVGEWLREEYEEVAEELTHQVHGVGETTSRHAQSLTNEAQEQVHHLRDNVQHWTERLKQRSQTWLDKAQSQGQHWGEQLREQAEHWQEELAAPPADHPTSWDPDWDIAPDDRDADIPDTILDEDWDIEPPSRRRDRATEPTASASADTAATEPPPTPLVTPPPADATSPPEAEEPPPLAPPRAKDIWDDDWEDEWDIETPPTDSPPLTVPTTAIPDEEPVQTIDVAAVRSDRADLPPAASSPAPLTVSPDAPDTPPDPQSEAADDDDPWI